MGGVGGIVQCKGAKGPMIVLLQQSVKMQAKEGGRCWVHGCRRLSGFAGLLHPADTVMDLNIGAALWLAARAEGPTHLYGPRSTDWQDGSCYRSQSRIVLVGMFICYLGCSTGSVQATQ